MSQTLFELFDEEAEDETKKKHRKKPENKKTVVKLFLVDILDKQQETQTLDQRANA